ncbi:MAG: hypothetical protein GY935_04340 [Gammaproteobacteria bacterium]|nr:hypothetical protein [Gammaproteobacteria bacterium]
MKQDKHSADSIINFILALFAQRGAQEYMGETVSMTQHMEQSAACAVADDAPDSLVVSALLRDIGHFVGEHPIEALENGIDSNHETMGASYLEAHFLLRFVSRFAYTCPPNAIFATPTTGIGSVCPMSRLTRSISRAAQ